jgi:hypothetical protein
MVVQKYARELEIGKKLYDGSAGTFLGTSGRSQADVVRIAIEHRLFAECFLRREYQRVVGREPTRRSSPPGPRRSKPIRRRTARCSPAGSTRRPTRSVSDTPADAQPLFVRALGVDLLGRVPSDDESFRLRTALDGLSDPDAAARRARAPDARLGKVKLPARERSPIRTRGSARLSCACSVARPTRASSSCSPAPSRIPPASRRPSCSRSSRTPTTPPIERARHAPARTRSPLVPQGRLRGGRAARDARPRALAGADRARKARHVVLIAFAGGVRTRETFGTPGNVPTLQTLADQGVLYTRARSSNLGHFGAAMSLFTGIAEPRGIRENARGPDPTLFEYVRKELQLSATTSGSAPRAARSRPTTPTACIPTTGRRSAPTRSTATACSTPTSSRSSSRSAGCTRCRGGGAAARAHARGPRRRRGRGGGLVVGRARSSATSSRSSRAARPTSAARTAADAKALRVARKLLVLFKPRLIAVVLQQADIAHNSFNGYVEIVRQNDVAIGELWKAVQLDPELAQSTAFVILPEFGRDKDLNPRRGSRPRRRQRRPQLRLGGLLGPGLQARLGRHRRRAGDRRVLDRVRPLRRAAALRARQGPAGPVRLNRGDRGVRQHSSTGAGALALVVLLCPRARRAGGVPGSDGTFASANGCPRLPRRPRSDAPAGRVTCVDCHGGDAAARTKSEAHVASRRTAAGDERVAPLDEDLAGAASATRWTCASRPRSAATATPVSRARAHEPARHHRRTPVGRLLRDGPRCEEGLAVRRLPGPRDSARKGEIAELAQVPALREDRRAPISGALRRPLAQGVHAVPPVVGRPRRARPRRLRRRLSRRGLRRVPRALRARRPVARAPTRRSRRASPAIPRRHELTRAPPTQTCATCHYGDAAIGLDFRGLAQLPPGAPGGPQIPGSTDAPLNRAFYLDDPALCPPDVHHQRGMHCIDCHTANDVMGDGELHGSMENAVEISCSDCHGTFTERATLRTERGTPLAHLRRDGDRSS